MIYLVFLISFIFMVPWEYINKRGWKLTAGYGLLALLLASVLAYFIHPAFRTGLGWTFFIWPWLLGTGISYMANHNIYGSEDQVTHSLDLHFVSLVLRGAASLALVLVVIGYNMFGLVNISSLSHIPQVRHVDSWPAVNNSDIPVVPESVALQTMQNSIGTYGESYEISNIHMERVHGRLYWIGAMDFRPGFFRWKAVHETAPGYMMLDANNPNATPVVKAGLSMRYTPNAEFGYNLSRLLAEKYPEYLKGAPDLEVSPKGQVYWVVGLYSTEDFASGRKLSEIALVNPVTGNCTVYLPGHEPSWVNEGIGQYSSSLYADYLGMDSNGFWDKLVTDVGLSKAASAPVGVIGPQGKLYWFIPMTSTSSSDNSTVGFFMVDAGNGQMLSFKSSGIQNPVAIEQRVNGSTSNTSLHADTPMLYNLYGKWAYIVPVVNAANKMEDVAIVDPVNSTPPIISPDIQTALNSWANYLASGGGYQVGTGAEVRSVSGSVVRVAYSPVGSNPGWVFIVSSRPKDVFLIPGGTDSWAPLIEPGDKVSFTYRNSFVSPIPVVSITDENLHM